MWMFNDDRLLVIPPLAEDENDPSLLVDLCERVEVVAKHVDLLSGEELLEIEIRKPYGVKRFVLERRKIIERQLLEELTAQGLSVAISPESALAVKNVIVDTEANAPLAYTHGLFGIHMLPNGYRYFLGHHPMGANWTTLQRRSTYKDPKLTEPKGDFGKWRRFILDEVVGHPALSIALMLGATSPVAYILNEASTFTELPLWGIIGESSTGKSTILYLIASMYANPARFIQSFDATNNAFSAMLQEHPGLPLLADEATYTPDSFDLDSLIYSLPAGREKRRCAGDGTLKDPIYFTSAVILTSETSVLERSQQFPGQKARVVEFSLPWFDLADNSANAAKAERIKKYCAQNYGWAVDRMMELLLSDGFEKKLVKKFLWYSDLSGYKILGYDQAGGKECHLLCHTSDGGSTWNKIDSNIDAVYPHMVSGISFMNESIGFLTYRHDSFYYNTAILFTRDGGTTWVMESNICELLSGYSMQGYMLEASEPSFENNTCYFKIKAIRHNETRDDIFELTIMSADYENWAIVSPAESTYTETSCEIGKSEIYPPYETVILRSETRTIHEWTPGHTDWAELLSVEGITYSGDFYSECTYNLSYMLPPENELLLFPQILSEEFPCLYAMGIWHIPQGSYPADISELPHIEEMLYQKRTYFGGENTIIYEYALLRPYADNLVLFIRVRSRTEIQEWITILEFLRSIELKERVEYKVFATDNAAVFRENEKCIRIECADGKTFRYTSTGDKERILGVTAPTANELRIGVQRSQNCYEVVFSLVDGTSIPYNISEEILSEVIDIPSEEVMFCGWNSYASGLIDAYVTTAGTQYTIRRLTDNTWDIHASRFVYDEKEIAPTEILAFWQCVIERMRSVTQLTSEMPALYDGLTLYNHSSRNGATFSQALFYRVDQIFTEECAARYRAFTDFYGRSCFREVEDGTVLITNKHIKNSSYWILPALILGDGNIEQLSPSEWRAKLMGYPNNDNSFFWIRKFSDDEWHVELPDDFGTARLIWQNDSWKWDISHQMDLQDGIAEMPQTER